MEPFTLPGFTLADMDPYRLGDTIFWGIIAASLILCLIHAFRRAFRHPTPGD